jgi:hypothetical protein
MELALCQASSQDKQPTSNPHKNNYQALINPLLPRTPRDGALVDITNFDGCNVNEISLSNASSKIVSSTK